MGVPEPLGGSGLPVGPAVALATRLGSALLPEPTGVMDPIRSVAKARKRGLAAMWSAAGPR